jgi:hypothetical protein
VADRAAQDARDLVLGQRLEPEHRRTRQQRGRDGPRRILRRRTEEDDASRLDALEQRVLLVAREPVDLVDKEQRPPPRLAEPARGALDLVAQLLHARRGAVRAVGVRARARGDHLGQRGLARARRPRDDHRLQRILLDQPAQQGAFGKAVLLPCDLVERARTHAHRKRRGLRAAFGADRRPEVLGHAGRMVRGGANFSEIRRSLFPSRRAS